MLLPIPLWGYESPLNQVPTLTNPVSMGFDNKKENNGLTNLFNRDLSKENAASASTEHGVKTLKKATHFQEKHSLIDCQLARAFPIISKHWGLAA